MMLFQSTKPAAFLEEAQKFELNLYRHSLPEPAPSKAFNPNPGQLAAINGLVAFASTTGRGNFASLIGPAGTGKSTISRIIRKTLVERGCDVGLAAPTHKACGVLAAACGVPKADTVTFASLLALREKQVKDKITFVRDYRRKPRLNEHQIWLCDEASMMEPELLALIGNEIDIWQKFIFIGDKAQLPPVNTGKISPALECDPYFELNQVMRHDGAVLDAATAIRATTGNTWRTQFYKSVQGIGSAIHAYANKREWQLSILDMAAKHKDDPDYFRVICYRRAEVAKYNLNIRRHIYGPSAPPFLEGERLMTVEAIKDRHDPDGLPLYGSSREIVILSTNPIDLKHPAFAEDVIYKTWKLKVLAEGEGEYPTYIYVIDPTHEGKLQVALTALSDEAKNNVVYGQADWAPFWALKNVFAEVQPIYAMTVHKSQGSQFKNVFISPDLDTAPGAKSLRRHLWYTAFTRAQSAVHLVADQEVQG